MCFSEAIIYSAVLSSFVTEHAWSGQFAHALCERSFVLPFKTCFFFSTALHVLLNHSVQVFIT